MQLLEKKELANGVTLTFYDKSRKVAGDRWLVQLCCKAEIPARPYLTEWIKDDDVVLRDAVLRRMGEMPSFSVIKERNFVAADDKDSIIAGFLEQANYNMIPYLSSPNFPRKFLSRRYEELKKEFILEKLRPLPGEPEEDTGPADFSSCFRD